MKVPYGEGLTIHIGPGSCVGNREGVGEALTGSHAGWVLSRERIHIRGADPVGQWGLWDNGEGHTDGRAMASTRPGLARSLTPRTHGSSPHGNWEICRLAAPGEGAVRIGKVRRAVADDARTGEV